MSIFLFGMILTLLLLKTSGISDTRQSYVKPEDYTDTCPGYPCEAIDYYANNTALLVNYTLLFLHGTHKLSLVLMVTNSTALHFMATNTSGHSESVTIACSRPAGLVFSNVHTLSLRGLTFLHCGNVGQAEVHAAALQFENVVDLELQAVHVLNSTGYGVLAKNIFGKSSITDCSFQYNRGSATYNGGNAYVEYMDCPLSISAQHPPFLVISSSIFSHGDYDSYNHSLLESTLATGLTIILSCSEVTVHLLNVTMKENCNSLTKGIGGNLFVHFYNETDFTSNYVFIQGSHFLDGKAATGGGIGVTILTQNEHEIIDRLPCNNTLLIRDSEISRNRAVNGGGLFLEFVVTHIRKSCPVDNFYLINTTFKDNVAERSVLTSAYDGGAAIHIVDGFIRDFSNELTTLYVHIHNVTIQGSKLSNTEVSNSFSSEGVAAVNILKFAGDMIISDTNIIQNEATAISIIKSQIKFVGEIFISNNTGINGGGLILCESSYMLLAHNTTVHFTDNHASHFGGGIYAEKACRSVYPSCFYQLPTDGTCEKKTSPSAFADCYNVHVIMRRNTAGYAGDHIYGGSVARCNFHHTRSNIVNSSVFYSIFDVRKNDADHHFSAVTSDAVKVCGCSRHQHYNCLVRKVSYQGVYPGQTITIPVVLVGQLNGAVAGIVTINNLEIQFISNTSSCTDISITTMKSSKSDTNTSYSFEVLNEAVSISQSKDVNNYYGEGRPFLVLVPFRDCPVGFKLDSDGKCGCVDVLCKSFKCDIDNLTITRRHRSWIGYNSVRDGKVTTGVLYHEICPFDYCKLHDVNVSINDTNMNSDLQCSLHRTGILCGACEGNYSVAIGSTQCLDCSTKPTLYVFFVCLLLALTGLLIVFLLVVFNITTTDGTMSGLLFYVNILYSNKILFKFTNTNILTVFIAWLNLDSGFTYCLYDGMDMYANAWLLFVYPLSTWSLVVLLIVLSQRYDRVANLLGGNAVKMLATLIELSYYGTITACISALSFTAIEYPSYHGSTLRYVWLNDGNVDYLSGKHVPLFMVGMLFSVLVLSFTAMLLFVQPLQRYSHVYCFRWVNRLKPLIDAYTAPHIIKDHCRYWMGLLLLFRGFLAICFAVNIENKPENNLAAIMVACVLIFATALAVGGVYKTTLLNLLNASSFANLTLLTVGATYFLSNDKLVYTEQEKHRNPELVLVYLSAGIAVLTTTVVLSWHIYKRFAKCFKCRRRSTLLADVNENSLLQSRTE